MELKDYLRLLRRSWWLLVLCTAVGGFGAYTATQRQAEVYGSSLVFYLSDAQGRPVNPLIAQTSQNRFASYATLVTNRAALVQVARTSGVSGFGASAASIPGTIFLRLSTTASSAEQALAVAQAYATEFPSFVTDFEGGADGGTETSLRVLEPPRLQPALISPDEQRNLLLGLALGLVVGVSLLLVREALDNKVRDVDELERLTDVGVAAAVPFEFRGEQLVTERRPRSRRAEAVRLVRTNVQFSGIGGPLRTLVVTSGGPGEGKTSVATDLAVAYAQAGQRVLLVDADLRKPRVAEIFDMDEGPGVTNVLVGDVSLDEALQPYGDGHVMVLTSGTRPAKPSELLSSDKMGELLGRLRERADLVIIDTAPILPVADTTAMLVHIDAVLLVVRVGTTTRTQLKTTLTRLRSVETRVIGLVANGAATEKGDGYYTDSKRRLVSRRREHGQLLEVSSDVVAPRSERSIPSSMSPRPSPPVSETPRAYPPARQSDTVAMSSATPATPPVDRGADDVAGDADPARPGPTPVPVAHPPEAAAGHPAWSGPSWSAKGPPSTAGADD